MTSLSFETLRRILLLKFIHDYEGINGRLFFQKFLYFLQELGAVSFFDYDFEFGMYGPYSEELEDDVIYLCENECIDADALQFEHRLIVNRRKSRIIPCTS